MPQAFQPVAAVLILLAGAVAAQQATDCKSLDPARPGDAYRAFDCVTRLEADLIQAQERITAMETRLDTLSRQVEAFQPAKLLGAVNERIDALTIKLAAATPVPAHGAHPQTRAVVAYTSQPGHRTCPDGWSVFEPAKDRFIVGVGDDHPVIGGTGNGAPGAHNMDPMQPGTPIWIALAFCIRD